MISSDQADSLYGAEIRGHDDDKIGDVDQVYVDDSTGQVAWVTVRTGFFGTNVSFVPLAEATFDGDVLRVPYDKDTIKDAPNADPDAELSSQEESELYAYYSVGGTGYVAGTTDDAAADYENTAVAGSDVDDAMTRSEERLNVDTETREAGRVRLRKYVVTEEQTVTVPVTREEVRLEREPITEENRADALDGPAISEAEHEVVLHEERPVVTVEAVPVERVRLSTDQVTEQETVTEEVRKEQIEVEQDGTVDGSGGATSTDSYENRQL